MLNLGSRRTSKVPCREVRKFSLDLLGLRAFSVNCASFIVKGSQGFSSLHPGQMFRFELSMELATAGLAAWRRTQNNA